MPSDAHERIYRPQRTFDDDLMDLSGFFTVNELAYDGIDGAKLAALAAEQREERAERGRVLGGYRAVHEAFIRNQARRHSTYMQALEHARAKFRDDSAKLKELERYRREVGRNGNGALPAEEPVTPVAPGPA